VRFIVGLWLVLGVAAPARADFLGAAVSHTDRAGPIAVWSRDTLQASRDDGASFVSMLLPVTNVRDVVVEASGALLVLGGTSDGERTLLARIHPDGTVSAVDVPSWISELAVGGDAVVALMPYEGAIAIARGTGPFVVHRVPPVFSRAECGEGDVDPAMVAACASQRLLASGASLAVDRDGTVHVVDVEVSTCGSSDQLEWARTVTFRRDGTSASTRLVVTAADVVYPTRWTAAPRGWAYAIASDGRFAALAAGRTHVLDGARGDAQAGGAQALLAGNGTLTVGQAHAHLVRLDGVRARPLADVPDEETFLADVDARGRVLALSRSGLHRWSRRSGWSALPLQSPGGTGSGAAP
jgi:hypothetical protein